MLLWFATGLQSHRLFYKFRKRHPEIAAQEIPFAFDFMAHPDKFLFFFKKRSLPILKSDPVIWTLRQQVKTLAILSLAVPFTGFGILMSIALYSIYVYCAH
jgi:hypothetical protein